MAQVNLYSTEQGKKVQFDLEVDQNGEIIARHEEEFVKFPAGLSKKQFEKLVSQHNQANEGIVARTPEEIEAEATDRKKSEQLLEDL